MPNAATTLDAQRLLTSDDQRMMIERTLSNLRLADEELNERIKRLKNDAEILEDVERGKARYAVAERMLHETEAARVDLLNYFSFLRLAVTLGAVQERATPYETINVGALDVDLALTMTALATQTAQHLAGEVPATIPDPQAPTFAKALAAFRGSLDRIARFTDLVRGQAVLPASRR